MNQNAQPTPITQPSGNSAPRTLTPEEARAAAGGIGGKVLN